MQYKGAYIKSSVLSVAMCGGSFKDPEHQIWSRFSGDLFYRSGISACRSGDSVGITHRKHTVALAEFMQRGEATGELWS